MLGWTTGCEPGNACTQRDQVPGPRWPLIIWRWGPQWMTARSLSSSPSWAGCCANGSTRWQGVVAFDDIGVLFPDGRSIPRSSRPPESDRPPAPAAAPPVRTELQDRFRHSPVVLEQQAQRAQPLQLRIADWITRFAGR
jgi:hypothetical protein